MRPEGNPLDLNNLPEDYTRDGKQTSEDTSSVDIYRKKKSGVKEPKDEPSKVYECRFCSLKFCKSQALGGHMNRHRQERETETLNKARQLVFTNDLVPPHHLGYVSSAGGPPMPYHSAGEAAFRSLYPTRLFPPNPGLIPPHAPPSTHPSPPPPPPPPPPFIYASPQRLIPVSGPPATNDYFLGQVLSTGEEGNYTCIGAPVVVNGGGNGIIDLALHNHEEGINWRRR